MTKTIDRIFGNLCIYGGFFLIWAWMQPPLGYLTTSLLFLCVPIIFIGWSLVDSTKYVTLRRF